MKTKLIEVLIGNAASGWTAEDRPFLETLNEQRLQQFVSNNEEPDVSSFTLDGWLDAAPSHLKAGIEELRKKATAPLSQNNQALSPEQWLAACPPGFRDQFNAGQQLHANERARLIGVITANSANVFTDEQLKQKPFDELNALAALAGSHMANNGTQFDYSGSGAQPMIANAGDIDLGGLPAPRWV